MLRLLSATLAVALITTPLAAQDLTLKPGDHVAIIGNTLADRMQHDGWLETYLTSRFPKHNLVFRNLGFAADEVPLNLRTRSDSFGSPDAWLTKSKADVIFAFFGYNESYAGEAGLDAFKKQLDGQVKAMLKQKYNGSSPPRIVLFSPTAFENHKTPNLPDGALQNKNLALYTAAIKEVAQANQVGFVDLFEPSQKAYSSAAQPLTINGVHLTEPGNHEIAKIIDKAFAGKDEPKRTTESMEKIRQAVMDKNFYWFNRYRTTDGYSIYGGRSGLKFVGGQTNFVVMQREMEILDQMTANRDPAVWAAAQGKEYKVDDKGLSPHIPVETNKKGPLDGGKHLFLSGEEAIKKMKVGKGLQVNLFASEEQWPELAAPVQMTFDTKGRLWVAVWPSYPHWKPGDEMNDKILIFEDTDGDGKADKMTVFADKLHNPTGFELWNGGCIVAHAPDLMFLKDTNGDDKADVRTRILSGIDSADTHHTANSFVLDPGGALYFQEGVFHHTQVETPYGPPTRCINAGVYRYEPRTQKFETYVAFGFANPHGHVFDRWGQDIIVDGTGAQPRHGTLFSGQVDFPNRHGGPPQVYQQKTRPCSGTEILSSQHFPPEFEGNFCVANVIGFQGILRYKIEDKGASIKGTEQEPIVFSSDPNFRPSDLRTGPDGALYFIDWHNPIIGHMQHNLRDPSRDHTHGRIYRVTAVDRPLSKSPKIAGATIEELLNNLKHPEDRVRYRSRIELSGRPTADVIAAAAKWEQELDPKDPDVEHHRLEALWLHQAHNRLNNVILAKVLQSPDFRARAAATKVVCYEREKLPNALAILKKQINDSHPRVRLEAIRALSFFKGEEPINIALELMAQPTDEYLNFVFNETLNTLERRVGGAKINRANIAASLVKMMESAAPQRKMFLIDTICRLGGASEMRTLLDQALLADAPADVRNKTLDALADAAQTRKIIPKFDAAELKKLLKDEKVQPDAIRLAVAWKSPEVRDDIRGLALERATPELVRLAAIDALASFGDEASVKALLGLSNPPLPAALRFRAAAALAKVDMKQGAEVAAKVLADSKDTDDPSVVIQEFLARKNGSDILAKALDGVKMSPDVAKQSLRAMYLAGRNDAALSNVLSTVAGLADAAKIPTGNEIRAIGDEAMAKGDAARGERIFRRAELGCVNCHALHKTGGNIGPDLGPVGGASPMDYIVQSILDPNASIKEEYLTKTITTDAGKIITGIVLEKKKEHVILRDATGKKIKLAATEIDEEFKGKSLMPEGVTRILTKAETLDLIRFVSELGKPGPYAVPTNVTLQRWKKLKTPSAGLKAGVPTRDVLREALLSTPPEGWENAFTLVNGILPLDEFKKAGAQPEPIYLQTEILVNTAGPLTFALDGPGGTTFWVDDDAYEKTSTVTLTPGRHRVVLRAVAADGAGGVRIELRKPADSKIQFELPVNGE